jgi:hypothetical protein
VVGGAVVGSAAAANKNKAAAEQAQQQRQEEQQQSVAAAAGQPAVEAQTMDEKLATVAKLAELHKAGTLTDEEFAQQKAQILGS